VLVLLRLLKGSLAVEPFIGIRDTIIIVKMCIDGAYGDETIFVIASSRLCRWFRYVHLRLKILNILFGFLS
jgi:hypothetical protein